MNSRLDALGIMRRSRAPLFCVLVAATLVLVPPVVFFESDAGFSDQTTASGSTFSSCGPLSQEAEDGVLTGNFVVASSGAASGGSYVHVPNGSGNGSAPFNGNAASYCFDVTTSGVYTIIGIVESPSFNANTFFVTVNGSPGSGYLWDTPAISAFAPYNVSDRGGADPVQVSLTAGFNNVTIHLREDGTRLDTLSLNFVGT